MFRSGLTPIISVFLALVCAGCGNTPTMADKQARKAIGPEGLDGSYAINKNDMTLADAIVSKDASIQAAWLAMAKMDSMAKCDAYTTRLTIARSGTDLTLDIATLALAGASSITLPVRSANTLAALAGISAGTRAAIDEDVYQQNTAPFIAQQINLTYWSDIKAYSVPSSAGPIDVGNEYAKIIAYHHECSLTAALGQLAKATATANSQLTIKDITDGAKFTAGTLPIAVAASGSKFVMTLTVGGQPTALPAMTGTQVLAYLSVRPESS